MNLAKYIAHQNACPSRYVGAVVTDKLGRKILGTGYNGPPRDVPHCYTKEHIQNILVPLGAIDKDEVDSFHKALNGGCPRKKLECKPGERPELCSCEHAERNCIYNAACDLYDCVMFCYCGVPCFDCSKAIIQSGIKTVYCLKEPDYSPGSRWLLNAGGVLVIEV